MYKSTATTFFFCTQTTKRTHTHTQIENICIIIQCTFKTHIIVFCICLCSLFRFFNGIIFFTDEKHLQIWNQIKCFDALVTFLSNIKIGFKQKSALLKHYLYSTNLQYGQLNGSQVSVTTIDNHNHDNCNTTETNDGDLNNDTSVDGKKLTERQSDNNTNIGSRSARLLSEKQQTMAEIDIAFNVESAAIAQEKSMYLNNNCNVSGTYTYTTPNTSPKGYICNRIETASIQKSRDQVLL